jgi:hypothetical protein
VADGLYPTPTRLALLRDVADPETSVLEHWSWRTDKRYTEIRYPDGDRRQANARIEELRAAGWVRLGSPSHPSMYASRPWELTDAGRKLFAENEEKARG